MQINLNDLGITKEALTKTVLSATGLSPEGAVLQLANELNVDIEQLAASQSNALRHVRPEDLEAIRKGAEATQRVFG